MQDFTMSWEDLTFQNRRLEQQRMRYSSLPSIDSKTSTFFHILLYDCSSSILFCRVKEFRQFSEKSDVYSFGVFLFELISGQKATDVPVSDPSYTLVDWVSRFRQFSKLHFILADHVLLEIISISIILY